MRLPFVVPALMVLTGSITALETVPLSLSKSHIISPTRHGTMDAVIPSFSLSSIDRSASFHWLVATPDFKFIVAIHGSSVVWIVR